MIWSSFFKTNLIAEGINIDLRKTLPQDFKRISKWFKNPDIMGNAFGIIADDDYIKKISADYLHEIMETPANAFIITDKSQKPIGLIRFSLRKAISKYCVLGILLGEKKNLGRGLGTEAVKLAAEYFFTKKHLSYIELDTAIFNERAQKCFKKCGFKSVGEFEEVDYNTGNIIYKVLMRLDREDHFALNKNTDTR